MLVSVDSEGIVGDENYVMRFMPAHKLALNDIQTRS
jgi:hypothetical protein